MPLSVNDLGQLPEIHPRVAIVSKARRELEAAIMKWQQSHDLTRAEHLSLLVGLVEEDLSFAIASERRVK